MVNRVFLFSVNWYCLKFFCFFISNCILIQFAKAQSSPPSSPGNYLQISDVLPPTPNASALGKYGGIDVSHNSGSLNKTIPLNNFQYRDISIPISLTYSTSGFKPDENPSYVGMNWVLNAGGVITRSIYGAPDENSQRLIGPSQILANQESLDFLEYASLKGGSGDSEPDVYNYNFNGYTGRFVLDENMIVRGLPANNLKIEYNLTTQPVWNFKITTPDGFKYYFGGSTATEKTRKETSCGKPYEAYLPTSWYLTKIESPVGNIVNFTYTFKTFNFYQGLIESLIANNPYNSALHCTAHAIPGPDCQFVPSSLCYSIINAYGYMLSGITTSDGGYVEFENMTGNLYSAIRIFDYKNVKKLDFSFVYQNVVTNLFGAGYGDNGRPFLLKIGEKRGSSSELFYHEFFYNDLLNIPSTLTKSLDHWGYFNGKTNSSLVELPEDLLIREKFPTATANRNADPIFASKGILSKILYPTGGYDLIEYEGNKYRGTKNIKPPLIQKSAIATGTGFKTEIAAQSSNFIVSEQHPIKIQYTFLANGSGVDPIHHLGTVGLYTSSGTPIFEYTHFADNVPRYEVLTLSPGTYYLKVYADGSIVTSSASLQVRDGVTTAVEDNYDCGGLRVKMIKSYSSPTTDPVIKKFLYNKLTTPLISSGANQAMPSYFKSFTIRKGCSAGVIPGAYTYDYCQYDGLYSYSLNSINLYPGGSSYEYVIESNGEDFENGATEYHFRVNSDANAATYNTIGAPLVGAPVSNSSRLNGALLDKTIYKAPVNNVFEPVNKIVNTYKIDARKFKIISGYPVNKSQIIANYGVSALYENVQAYEASVYNLVSHWEYIEKTEEFNYLNGVQNANSIVNKFFYDNEQHMLLTRKETTNSKGTVYNDEITYPKDYSAVSSADPSVQAIYLMNTNGLLSNPIEFRKYLQNSDGSNKKLLESILLTYYPSNFKLNESFKLETSTPINDFVATIVNSTSITKDSRYKRRLKVNSYDTYGNIIEQTKEDDIVNTYLWDYNSLLPVGHVMNAPSSKIAYTSFETSNKGNWSYSGTSTISTSSPSGDYVYTLTSNSISKTNLSAGEYLLSYWSSNTSANYSISGATSNIVSSGQVKNGWKYYHHKLTLSGSTLTISGTGLIDEVRIIPSGSQMVTKTYNHLVGISSELDNNSNFLKYKYDTYNRLMFISDDNGRILKQFCYKYYDKLIGCGEFGNEEQSGQFTKQCTSPAIGQTITYKVPAGKYSSLISTADANSKAILDVQQNGQSYANTNGLCEYFNDAQTKSFTKQGCLSPSVGEVVPFTIAANTYSSVISKADANSKAIAALDVQGQLNANANGTCIGGTTGVFAKITYSNVVHDDLVSTADFYIKFYSDQNCTVPLSVSNITVNYAQTRTLCQGGGNFVTNLTKLCTGNSVYLGNLDIRLSSSGTCFAYDYSVKTGTGYYPCGYVPPILLD